MTRRSYVAALDDLLVPEGFERQGDEWIRERDGFLDIVNKQVSVYLGVTANVMCKDLTSQKILLEVVPKGSPRLNFPDVFRVSELMGVPDLWWRRDPKGPAEMAEALRDYGLPYFDRMRSLEFQLSKLGRGALMRHVSPTRLYRAVTLYRLGEFKETCESLVATSQFITPEEQSLLDAVRRRLGCSCP